MKNLIKGQNYLVATFGVVTTWNEAKFYDYRPKTETTNELYFFSGKNGCYPVLAEDLNLRVKEVNK